MTTLKEDGYIILRNTIDTNLGSNCLNANKLDYKCIYNIIKRKYFPIIQKYIPDTEDASFRRFIFSNNSYSSIDSLYHGNSYNNSNIKEIPIYVAYIFYTTTTIELIPSSHIKSNKMNYSSKKRLKFKNGDVIILNTNLHNRTINNGNTKILKIMDIIPNEEIKGKYSHNFEVVQMNNSIIIKYLLFTQKIFSKMEKLMDFVNYIYYYFVYYQVQYKFLLEDKNNKGKLISYEANSRKHIDDISDKENWNTYIITEKNIKTQNIGNLLSIILVLCLVVIYVFFSITCRNKNIKECYIMLYEKYIPKNIKDYIKI